MSIENFKYERNSKESELREELQFDDLFQRLNKNQANFNDKIFTSLNEKCKKIFSEKKNQQNMRDNQLMALTDR